MGTKEDKQIERIMNIPADYTFSEARSLLSRFGFVEKNKGKTSGSRVMFFRERDNGKILLHKPHPGDEMKRYAVSQLKKQLIELGDLHDE